MRVFWAILWKDVRYELRRRELLAVMTVFGLLVIVVFVFALGIRPESPSAMASAVLWIATSFAGTLGLNRSLAMERDEQCFRALLLSPADRSWVFLAKATGNLLFLVLVQLVLVPLLLVFFGIGLPAQPLILVAVLVLGSVGYVGVGTLFATMATSTRMRDWLLPILLFPVEVPVLIAAVKATGFVLAGAPWGDISLWIAVLVAFDLIFLALSILSFGYVVEE
jgi:heme exporter protein B